MNKNDKVLKQILLDVVGYKEDKVFEDLEYIQSNKKGLLHEIENIEIYQNRSTKDFIEFTSSLIDKETQEVCFTNKLVECNSYFYVLFTENNPDNNGSYTYCLDICSYKIGSMIQLYYDTDENEFVLGSENDLQFLYNPPYSEEDVYKLMVGILPPLYSYLSECNDQLNKYKANNEL